MIVIPKVLQFSIVDTVYKNKWFKEYLYDI